MKIIILGAASFIGTNLTLKLLQDKNNEIVLVDKKRAYFSRDILDSKVKIIESNCDFDMDFSILKNQEVVYHLVSTNIPTNSNQFITQDMNANITFSSNLFDACVKYGIKKVVFISSGGTVYGKNVSCPISEDAQTNPISSYGLQKLTIEKLLQLYNFIYNLDYRIIRLANPYGPYQRPNGLQGAVTTFIYKALLGEELSVYGDGSVIRDYIYIDDAIEGILNISNSEKTNYRIFNLGCGYGTSINQVIELIKTSLGCELVTTYKMGRSVDVPVNYLDISRYEDCFGKFNPISLEEGIKKTAEFMKREII